MGCSRPGSQGAGGGRAGACAHTPCVVSRCPRRAGRAPPAPGQPPETAEAHLVIVVPQGPAQLVIVHVRFVFPQAPQLGHLLGLEQLELAIAGGPADQVLVFLIQQQLQQELPQRDRTLHTWGGRACECGRPGPPSGPTAALIPSAACLQTATVQKDGGTCDPGFAAHVPTGDRVTLGVMGQTLPDSVLMHTAARATHMGSVPLILSAPSLASL